MNRKIKTKKGFLLLKLFIVFMVVLASSIVFTSKEGVEYIQDIERSLKTYTKQEQETEEVTELKNPKEVNFKWNYNNKEYELDVTLYGSLYNYYSKQAKKYTCVGSCPSGWEEEYYNMFLKVADKDNTFSKLASQLEELGESNNLTDDQIVELTVAFVQSIPYDEVGATGKVSLARYPYEVLYENKGLCSGKSYLGALLVKELGYGVALFGFDKENHMVIGIKCPLNYSSYNSGYCYTELTTAGWKIGIENFDDIENITSTDKTPQITEDPEIYEITDGKTYEGIYQTLEDLQKIKTLKKEIDNLNYRINVLKEELDYYERIGDHRSYNKLVPTYNELISEHSKKVKEYNALIKAFSPEG